MGGEKPLARLAGQPLLAHVLAAVSEAGLDALVVAKPGSPLPALEVPLVIEPEEPAHPLCGVVSALRAVGASAPGIVAVGCDMPFLAPGLLSMLAGLGGNVVLQGGGRLQPLPARIDPRGLAALERSLAAGEALGRALAALGPRVLDERELARFGDAKKLCFSVNSPADLALAESWLAEPKPGSP
jgi:molybdopterin-guanine dinucleotide biosynthesis protein A